jgi:hypothetical protein
MSQENRTGAAHSAWCVQFGIGFPEDLDTASDHYESAFRERPPVLIDNAFRCRLRLNKDKLVKPRRLRRIDDVEKGSTPKKLPRDSATSPLLASYHADAIGLDRKYQIGSGGSSSVTFSFDRDTGKRIAVKHVSVADGGAKLKSEVTIMAHLNHPCVIRIIGWSDGRHSKWGEVHMEFAPNHSLGDLLGRARRDFQTFLDNPTDTAKLICSLVLGMRYIHSRGILHRDLKPANILLDEHWRPKISDFGVSRFVSTEGPPTAESGTLRYAAPEQFVEDTPHTTKTDVFSFGYILYEIITRKPVFSASESTMSVLTRIRDRDFPTLPAKFGALMQGLIDRCWSADPRYRPSFEFMFREFEQCGFAILEGADPAAIRTSVNGILALEGRQTNPQT